MEHAVYSCSLCPERFRKLHLYREHARAHVDFFFCEQCERQFSSDHSLLRHNLLFHFTQPITFGDEFESDSNAGSEDM